MEQPTKLTNLGVSFRSRKATAHSGSNHTKNDLFPPTSKGVDSHGMKQAAIRFNRKKNSVPDVGMNQTHKGRLQLLETLTNR